MREPKYTFELWQDGICVAQVWSPDLDEARREIMHYAVMYAQAGPCEIKGGNAPLFDLPAPTNPKRR